MVADVNSISRSTPQVSVLSHGRSLLGDTSSGRSMPDVGKSLPKNTVGVSESTKAAEALRQEDLQKMTDSLNKYMQSKDLRLQFSLDDDSGRTVIKVINAETDEVIRQFPPEEMLYLAKTISSSLESMQDGHTGFLLETEV